MKRCNELEEQEPPAKKVKLERNGESCNTRSQHGEKELLGNMVAKVPEIEVHVIYLFCIDYTNNNELYCSSHLPGVCSADNCWMTQHWQFFFGDPENAVS